MPPNPFAEEAEARLRLLEPERGLLRDTPIHSFDVLHAVLRASPSLDDGRLGIRRQLLMELCQPWLSESYLAALRQVWPPAQPSGLDLRLVSADPRPELAPDWRGAGMPASLAGAPRVELLSEREARSWPVRDQLGRHTCVAHAAACALELRQMPPAPPGPRFSVSFLYFHLRRFGAELPGQDMQRFRDGGAKLEWAKHVLPGVGICDEVDWPDSKPVDEAPSNLATARAKQPFQQIECWDLDPLPTRPDAPAAAILALLLERRPVAVSMPEFRDPKSTGETNWSNPKTWSSGEVLPTTPFWDRTDLGHAVCVLGFQPASSDPLGGWFIFRNSRGPFFAGATPDLSKPAAPWVPGPGYGAIQASLLDSCVYEIFSPR